jgi:uncharacterized membrane protein YfcA
MPVLVLLITALIGVILAIWVNVRILREKITKWTGGDLLILFAFSLGSFDGKQKELWMGRGFSEDEAKTILKQQNICLFEMPIGFVIGAIASAFLSR